MFLLINNASTNGKKNVLSNFMFPQDLLNFDDPLNVEAAEHYAKDKVLVNWFYFCTMLFILVNALAFLDPVI